VRGDAEVVRAVLLGDQRREMGVVFDPLLAIVAARMAGDFGSTFDPSLESLLLRSNSGTAHIVRVVGLAVLLLALDRASVSARAASSAGAPT